jgi:hypothetical protein
LRSLYLKSYYHEKESIKPGNAGRVAGCISSRLRAAPATCCTAKANTTGITEMILTNPLQNGGFFVGMLRRKCIFV